VEIILKILKVVLGLLMVLSISVIEAKEMDLYIPSTQSEVTAFWKHADNDKKNGFVICGVYVEYLFRRVNSVQELKQLYFFSIYSDGFYAELFVDYWVDLIKNNFKLFKEFYSSLDVRSRVYFDEIFKYNISYDVSKSDFEKMKQELKMK